MRRLLQLVAACLLSLPAAAQAAPRMVSLRDAVHTALARNPSVAVAEAEVRRAAALVTEVRGGVMPILSGVAAYTRLDSDRVSAGRTVLDANQLSASLNLTVPIIYPRSRAATHHAEDNVASARASAVDVQRQLAVAVGRAYLTTLAQHRIIDASQRARDTARAHHDFADQRYRGGIGTRLDEVRAAQELASAEAQLATAEANLVRAREVLGVLLAGDDDEGVDVLVSEEPDLGELPGQTTALGEVTVRRADILALKARLLAAERVQRDDWTDYSPFLSGNAQTFYEEPPTATVPRFGWQASLVLTVPFYDGGVRSGQARERRAVSEEARASLIGQVRQARSEVRSAGEAVRQAAQALASSREAARLAREVLDLSNQAYQGGVTTNLEVIDAERRSRDADTAVAVAEDNARQARLDLLAATGRFP